MQESRNLIIFGIIASGLCALVGYTGNKTNEILKEKKEAKTSLVSKVNYSPLRVNEANLDYQERRRVDEANSYQDRNH